MGETRTEMGQLSSEVDEIERRLFGMQQYTYEFADQNA